MKLLRYFLTGIIFSMMISSCVDDFNIGASSLDKQPGVDITIDTVFSKTEFAERFLWNTYSTLYYGLNLDFTDKGNRLGMDVLDGLTDNYQSYLNWGGIKTLYYNGKYSASDENTSAATKYHYSKEGSWAGIRKGWIFIENIDRVPDMDTPTKERLKGEAKMIIACHYADMFRHFGGVPLLKKALSANEDMKIARAPAKETMEYIVQLCDEAKAVLPWSLKPEDVAKWDGRFTGAAATGLKIRILLFGASPLFNSDTPYYTEGSSESIDKKQAWFGGYDPAMWSQVVTACDEFVRLNGQDANGGYNLVMGDPRVSFRSAYFSRGNGELLISTRVRATVPDYWNANYYCLQSLGSYGTAVPTLSCVDNFSMANGTKFNNSIWDKDTLVYNIANNGDTLFYDPFVNRDPRLYETCLVNNIDFQGRKSELWMGGRERGTALEAGAGASGFNLFKFIMEKNTATSIGAPAQWPYLRLAEIYLSYAEALSQSGRTEDAFQYVDMVRARVGLMGLKASNPGENWTKETFLEYVLKERSCEFGVEDVRWFDLVRWKRENDFRKSLYGIRIERVKRKGVVVPNLFSYKKFKLQKRSWQDEDGVKNFSPKWYLSAFPPIEIYKNYGLTQNPGW